MGPHTGRGPDGHLDWRKMSTRSFTPAQLRTTSENILRALGTPDDSSREGARCVLDAQLAGHGSHGLIRLMEYASFVERGTVRPAARPERVSSAGAMAVVDGNWGWGQPACHLAVAAGDRIARQHGGAAVTVRHCNHIGRIGEHAKSLAPAGPVGLARPLTGGATGPGCGRSAPGSSSARGTSRPTAARARKPSGTARRSTRSAPCCCPATWRTSSASAARPSSPWPMRSGRSWGNWRNGSARSPIRSLEPAYLTWVVKATPILRALSQCFKRPMSQPLFTDFVNG